MPETSTPNVVYERRKTLRSSTSNFVYKRKKVEKESEISTNTSSLSNLSSKSKIRKTWAISDNCSSSMKLQVAAADVSECSSSGRKLSGPIANMLRNIDSSHKSNVRIGEEFQVEVPDWSDSINNDLNDYDEPVELGSYQDWNSKKKFRPPIGNWLQCRQVMDDDGTICGKWRWAPLFEVQTDKWECFCTILWDPTHADCNVPQEMDTDQVLKQLKHIERLRPRIIAKRCKLGVNKGVNPQ